MVQAFGVDITHLMNHSVCLVQSLLAVDTLQGVYLRPEVGTLGAHSQKTVHLPFPSPLCH